MSKVKTDTSLWLHNKLGNVNDLWSAGSICSQLNSERLKNINDCFTELQPLVKLKLLISFLHIPRRNVVEWKNELKNIIEIAILDSDQWVSMVGELLKTYPQKGTINFEIEENSAVFNDLVNELKKLVKKHNDQGILPIECLYLNKNALNSIIGQIPPPTQHFKLKKNPKSFELKKDLLNKSQDASLNLKKGNLGLPMRNRSGSKDLNDQTPLKGIPRSLNNSQFKMPTIQNRLQIGAGRNPTRPSMPGVRTSSMRKDVGIKFLEQPVNLPDSKKKKKTHETTDNQTTANNNKTKDNDKAVEQTPAHYHYAAGLADYVPPSPMVHSSTYNDNQSTTNTTTNENLEQSQQPTYQQLTMNTMHYAPDHTITNNTSINVSPALEMQTSIPQTAQQHSSSSLNQQSPAKKTGIALTREQAEELRQISKSYPVGKSELSLIMSFMNGNRISPDCEDIVRVKLGEKRDIIKQPDGTYVQVISDGYYQMNYRTGEGFQISGNKRIVNLNTQKS